MIRRPLAVFALALTLSACAHHGPGDGPPDGSGRERNAGPPPGQALLRYDADHDGKLTWAEINAGLKAEFEAADKNHSGCLDDDEVRAINEARWAADPTSTPLVDWQHTGCIGYRNFAAAPLSLFQQLDGNHDGVLTPEEIKGGKAKEEKDERKPEGRRGRGGQGGGQGGGPPGGGPGGP